MVAWFLASQGEACRACGATSLFGWGTRSFHELSKQQVGATECGIRCPFKFLSNFRMRRAFAGGFRNCAPELKEGGDQAGDFLELKAQARVICGFQPQANLCSLQTEELGASVCKPPSPARWRFNVSLKLVWGVRRFSTGAWHYSLCS